MPRFTVFASTTPPNSDATRPGRPGLASDGTDWLVVTCRSSASGPGELSGVLVSAAGVVGTPFLIAPHDCQWPTPSVAFDGSNYLVVFRYVGVGVHGARVSRAGQVLDPDGGFFIAPDILTGRAVAFGGGVYLVALSHWTGSEYDVNVARVLPSGTVAGVASVSTAPGEQFNVNAIWHGDHFLVGWGDSPNAVINGTRVLPSGVVLDPAGVHLGALASGESGNPSMSASGGAALVTWNDARPGSQQILVSRVQTDGGRLFTADGGSIALTAAGSGGADTTLAYDGQAWVAAWSRSAYGAQPDSYLRATRITTSGAVSDFGGHELALPGCTSCRITYPNAASGGAGTLVVWLDNGESSTDRKTIQGALLP